MHLASAAPSRDNNFNLMRLMAALVVVVSHSYPLTYGHNGQEPLFRLVGMTMGSVAVDAFFVISGFLNTESLFRTWQPGRFVVARALRIYPALWVMVLVSVAGAALVFSELPFADFLRNQQTQAYVFKNTTLFFGAQYELPAFAQLPYPFAVNGSLWSLPIEVYMYAGLLLVWLPLGFAGKHQALRMILPAMAVASGLYFLWARPHAGPWALEARLLCLFAQGAAYAAWQDKIQLQTGALVAVIFLIAVCTLWPPVFYPAYLAGFAYALLCLAYLPKGWIRAYNRCGDVSYGIYIYAFPVQQAVVALLNPRSVMALVATATPFIVAIAVASWRWIEKPALSLKPKPKLPAATSARRPTPP